MKTLILVFIIISIIIGVFCVVIIIHDSIIDSKVRKELKNNKETNEKIDSKEEIYLDDTPSFIKSDSDLVVASDVAFNTNDQTLEEKYLNLDIVYKNYYDEIVKASLEVEGSKRIKTTSYEDYKIGKNRYIRIKIKRGVIVCELVVPNLTLKNYINDNKVSIKQAPATIKVVDEGSLNAVKDSIKIAVEAINEEKTYKKEQAKIKRLQKKQEALTN